MRSPTNLDFGKNDTVLALCRPNTQFSGLPLEKSSTFIQHDASSNAVKLMWNPMNNALPDDTQRPLSVIDREVAVNDKEDSVNNEVKKNDDSQS